MEKPRFQPRHVEILTIAALLLASCSEAPTQASSPTVTDRTRPKATETAAPHETQPQNRSPEVRCSAAGADDPNAILVITFAQLEKGTLDMFADRRPGTAATKPDKNRALTPYADFVRTGIDMNIPVGRQGNTLVTLNLNGCLVLKNEKPALEKFFKDLLPKPNNNTQTFYNGKPTNVMDSQVNPKNQNPFAGQQHIRFEVGRGSKPKNHSS